MPTKSSPPQKKELKKIVNERLMNSRVHEIDTSLSSKKNDDNVSIEVKTLRQKNDALENAVNSLGAENKILKETNIKLNDHIDELKNNHTKLLKKYQEKKEYSKKLLELLKIQSIFSIFQLSNFH